jgi:hypothetical protein
MSEQEKTEEELERFVIRDGLARDPRDYWWDGWKWSPYREDAALYIKAAVEPTIQILRHRFGHDTNPDGMHAEPWDK